MFAAFSLSKVTCQHLMLLVGFDTLTYRKHYDRSHKLVVHHLAAMKRHEFVTRASELGSLDYILHFWTSTEHNIRLPVPLLFDFSHRNGWGFDVIKFDEFLVQYQFHNPIE